MAAKLHGHVSWWYVCFALILLVGLWLAAGSTSADSGSRLAPSGAGARVGLLPICSIAADPPGAVLVAHVTWQGIAQPNHRNTTETLTLTLRLESGGPLAQYSNVASDASGFITVPVDSLVAGTYNYQAKGFRNLAQGGQVTLAGDPVTNLEMGLMKAGDASNDNVVNSTDFTILRAAVGWGRCHDFGCPFDPRPDFNNSDNVDATDFTLLKNNFGSGGAPPAGP
jgi:hypothetical protein